MAQVQRVTAVAGGVAALALVLGACTSAETAAPEAASSSAPAASPEASASSSAAPTTTASPEASPATGPGVQITYANYQKDPSKYANTDVVLFFSAPWCSSCQAAHESLEQSGVPTGLTVVDVDYDSEQDLRQKYGVTTQHTFVQIDEDGAEVTKFTGAVSGEDIQNQL